MYNDFRVYRENMRIAIQNPILVSRYKSGMSKFVQLIILFKSL